MTNPIAQKLGRLVELSAEDAAPLAEVSMQSARQVEAHEDIVREGDAPKVVSAMLSGWACRYKTLRNGQKQIVAFLLPGDVFDLDILISHQADHGVAALTPVCLAEFTRGMLDRLATHHPRVIQALLCDTLVTSAMQRAWIVNLGRRSAAERVAHLLCELFMRLQAIGLTEAGRCEMPITQVDLASATGLSAVHVNRSLQELRLAGLVMFRRRLLQVPDLAALQAASHFNSRWLHRDSDRTSHGLQWTPRHVGFRDARWMSAMLPPGAGRA